MKSPIKTVVLAASLAVLAACGTTSTDHQGNEVFGATMTDKTFGNSVREARIRQTIDLNAGSKHAATVGTDAKSADAAMQRYYKSFKEPEPTFKVLGIGDR
jgi:type IV pilus biogenesis protein CpaD/CtpE